MILELANGQSITIDTTEYKGDVTKGLEIIKNFFLRNNAFVSNIDRIPGFEMLEIDGLRPFRLNNYAIKLEFLLPYCKGSAHAQYSFLGNPNSSVTRSHRDEPCTTAGQPPSP